MIRKLLTHKTGSTIKSVAILWLLVSLYVVGYSQSKNDSILPIDTNVTFNLKDTLKKPNIKVDDDYVNDLKKKKLKDIKINKPRFNLKVKKFNLGDTSLTSIKRKKTFQITSGNVSVGYEYGFLPFSMLLSPPDKNMRTTGLINFEVKKLPFNASYYYSSLGYLSGINNHFNIKFDVTTFLQNLKEEILAIKIERSFKIDSLQLKKQDLSTNLDYYKSLQEKEINADKLREKQKDIQFPDTTISIPNDSIKKNKPDVSNADTTAVDNKKPKQNSYNEKKQKADSLNRKAEAIEKDIAEINKSIAELEKLNNYRSYTDNISANDIPIPEEQSKLMKFLLAIRKFEVGLTSPDFSEFLISRTMVRGINTEFQFKDYYVAFAYGTAVNVMLNSQISQPNVGEQFYNFLSVKNVDSGRKITVLKGGYGEKEGTHIFGGLLYGMGKLNYGGPYSDNEENIVVEIDGRLKFLKYHTLDLVYGRSALQVKSVLENDEKLFIQLFNFNNRSNALLSAYELKIKGTTFGLKYRLIDPFFRSFGVQFIRNDRVRYEAKVKQKIGKKVVLGAFARRENDNLLNIHPNKNVFLSYGADVSYRPTKHWLLKADYRPFVQQVNSVADTGSINNKNYIVNTVASYNTRIKNTYLTLTGVYSYYYLAGVTGGEIFRNLNLNLDLQFNKKISNAVIYNRFDATDTLVTLNNILENDFTIKMKRLSVTGIGKFAFADGSEAIKSGYGLKLSIPIFKKAILELAGERILLGDFYSNLLNINQEDFPYYFSGDLVLNF
ncbi:MAG: hypothetical protein KFKLKKLM_02051 [Flavobacteriales bacterium]|nr:hypothetical protein [Flavobacteriales bacterium]